MKKKKYAPPLLLTLTGVSSNAACLNGSTPAHNTDCTAGGFPNRSGVIACNNGQSAAVDGTRQACVDGDWAYSGDAAQNIACGNGNMASSPTGSGLELCNTGTDAVNGYCASGTHPT